MNTPTNININKEMIVEVLATRKARAAAFDALREGKNSREAEAVYDATYAAEVARLQEEEVAANG
jgi:hypothetical protein